MLPGKLLVINNFRIIFSIIFSIKFSIKFRIQFSLNIKKRHMSGHWTIYRLYIPSLISNGYYSIVTVGFGRMSRKWFHLQISLSFNLL